MRNFQPFIVGLFTAVMLLASYMALADQGYLAPGASANASRPCILDGVTAQKVTVSGTTAATSTVTGNGTIRVVCTTNAHFAVGASGVTATANDAYIGAGVPEYFVTNSSQKMAFIQDSAGGSCFVSSCK